MSPGPDFGRVTASCVSQAPGVSLEAHFERKVLNMDGSESGEYVINEVLIASLDCLVACCPWAGIQDCREQAIYLWQRAGFYRHFDGRDGSRTGAPNCWSACMQGKCAFRMLFRNEESPWKAPAGRPRQMRPEERWGSQSLPSGFEGASKPPPPPCTLPDPHACMPSWP